MNAGMTSAMRRRAGACLSVRLLIVWLLVVCGAAGCRDGSSGGAERGAAASGGAASDRGAAPAQAAGADQAPADAAARRDGRSGRDGREGRDRGGRDDADRAGAGPGAARRDLDADERCGGHTLSRHVGGTDAQLARRLRDERDISAASTYTDRDTAERLIAAALDADARRVRRWTARQGRRPNLTVFYRAPGDRPIGRSLRRGADRAEPCYDLRVVLRWREDLDDFCVLTSYPEVRR